MRKVKPDLYIDPPKPSFFSLEARPIAVVSISFAALISMGENVSHWLRSDATQIANLADMKDSREQTMAARNREIDAIRDELSDVRNELRFSREHPCEK